MHVLILSSVWKPLTDQSYRSKSVRPSPKLCFSPWLLLSRLARQLCAAGCCDFLIVSKTSILKTRWELELGMLAGTLSCARGAGCRPSRCVLSPRGVRESSPKEKRRRRRMLFCPMWLPSPSLGLCWIGVFSRSVSFLVP